MDHDARRARSSADSIRYYLTLESIGSIVVVLIAAVVFPVLLSRLKFQLRPSIVLAAIVVTAMGPIRVSAPGNIG